VIVRARSWVPSDMVDDDLLAKSEELLTAEPGDRRLLASTLLHPSYLYLAARTPVAATAAASRA
jgi:hypothetical protein